MAEPIKAADQAIALVRQAIRIEDGAPSERPVVMARVSH